MWGNLLEAQSNCSMDETEVERRLWLQFCEGHQGGVDETQQPSQVHVLSSCWVPNYFQQQNSLSI